MINFPIFEQLQVSDYGLFPGNDSTRPPGLHIDFGPGLKLIVGANGLGKTTLITMMYRVLTGPFDIPGLSGRSELGNVSLEPRRISTAERKMFADRVEDGASNAVAQLTLRLAETSVVIARNLSNLELVKFEIDGKDCGTDETLSFQQHMLELVGVWSFGDWILLLRHMVFYFEDRRSLVWDASAQRQLLRFLFLPANIAKQWTEDERAILELDSSTRNLQFAIGREEAELTGAEAKVKEGADVRQEMKALQKLQQIDTDRLEELNDSISEHESRREQARLRHAKAEQERETRYRELERAKLTAIEARFPKTSDTARYIVAQLLSEADCLVCGSHVPTLAETYEKRIHSQSCVICGSKMADRPELATTTADRRVNKAAASVRAIEPELLHSRQQLDQEEGDYNRLVDEVTQLRASIAQRSSRIDALVRRLPPGETELHRQREEMAAMRSRLASMRQRLTRKRNEFSAFVDGESRRLVRRSGAIKASFDRYAEGFLLEQCTLYWSPHRARLGQSGDFIDFPAFELEMTGANFPSAMRRTGPEQVSESQREFIDLAFRMSLMEVAGANSVGTLVIDAPESSLDAVFVTRAATVLSRFAKPDRGNRLIVTSNLVEGDLIPELLIMSAKPDKRLSHLVDLFKIAEPTAAIRKLKDEYRAVFSALLRKVTKPKRKSKRGKK